MVLPIESRIHAPARAIAISRGERERERGYARQIGLENAVPMAASQLWHAHEDSDKLHIASYNTYCERQKRGWMGR